eukprot:m.290471 g.290471  ORF g.290471 m.290471 type:complete len:258 (+) comp55079_c0_seq2:729-1502(+)
MVLEYVPGGELFSHLRSVVKFPESTSMFYGAQVTLALEYLHNLNIMYRDLKPENILFDARGYIKITDFGFAKKVDERTWSVLSSPFLLSVLTLRDSPHSVLSVEFVDSASFFLVLFKLSNSGLILFCRSVNPFCGFSVAILFALMGRCDVQLFSLFRTLCGTPEYLAPEIIVSKGYTKAVDWWALGILIYEMCAGHPPFFDDQPIKIYEKIVACKVPDLFCFFDPFLVTPSVRVFPVAVSGTFQQGSAGSAEESDPA